MAEVRAFPGLAPWKTAACEPLTGDASARKYFRLRAGQQTAILMDASRVPDSVAPFIRIAGHLRQIGFSTPEIFARDAESGLLLLEDFGDASFARLLEQRGCDAPSLKVTATPPSRVLEMPAVGDEASPSPCCDGASQLRRILHRLLMAFPLPFRIEECMTTIVSP